MITEIVTVDTLSSIWGKLQAGRWLDGGTMCADVHKGQPFRPVLAGAVVSRHVENIHFAYETWHGWNL